MRWIAVALLGALLPLLAGCAVPADEAEEEDPLFGLCPQWEAGPVRQSIEVHLEGNASDDRELGPANGTYGGKPLDLYRVHLDSLEVSGKMELRAKAADGNRLNIRDYRQSAPQLVPVVVFTDGSAAGKDFDVFLSSVAHGSTAAPAPVTLEWTQVEGSSTIKASIGFHYKVCGAAV